jgi:NDP-sugar pyrophosphorylase family protein
MLNVIIPLGSGKFDADNENYLYPLPLIDIQGKALIEYLLDNLNAIKEEKRFVFIVKETDCKQFHLDNILKQLVKNSAVVRIKGQTKGAVCSVLFAIDEIDKDEELIIVNSDQVIETDYNIVLERLRAYDGGVITFNSVHPRWSYIRTDNDNVVETAEKNPISNKAIAGFYYFKKAHDFINGAFKVVKFDENHSGSYYTSSVFNQLVLNGKHIGFVEISKEQYYSFYSPQKIKEFEEFLKSNHAKI